MNNVIKQFVEAAMLRFLAVVSVGSVMAVTAIMLHGIFHMVALCVGG